VSDLVNRLRVAAGEAKILRRESTAELFHETADALAASHARIGELTTALRELLDVSDSQKSLDIGQTRRTLAKARSTLSSPTPPPAASEMSDEDVVQAMVAKTLNVLRTREKGGNQKAEARNQKSEGANEKPEGGSRKIPD
jgi:hypothetical protein